MPQTLQSVTDDEFQFDTGMEETVSPEVSEPGTPAPMESGLGVSDEEFQFQSEVFTRKTEDVNAPTPGKVGRDIKTFETDSLSPMDRLQGGFGRRFEETDVTREDVQHGALLLGQSAVRSAGELADLPARFQAGMTRLTSRGLNTLGEAFGVREESPDDVFVEGTNLFDLPYQRDVDEEGNIVFATDEEGQPIPQGRFEALGTPETFGFESEKVLDDKDILVKMTGEALGPSGVFGLLSKAIRTGSSYYKTMNTTGGPITPEMRSAMMRSDNEAAMGDLLTDVKFGVYANTAGWTGMELLSDEDTPLEDKITTANLAAAAAGVGQITAPVVKKAISYLPTPQIIKKYSKNGAAKVLEGTYVDEGSKHYEIAAREVYRLVGTLVPVEQLPEINRRMEITAIIQKPISEGGMGLPDYQPTVGNIIGTEETMALQRALDTKNYAKADAQFTRTRLAVRELIRRMTTETDPEQRAVMSEALEIYGRNAQSFSQTLRAEKASLETAAREISDTDFSASENGAQIRQAIKDLDTRYEDHVDELYDTIDPQNILKYDTSNLQKVIKDVIEPESEFDEIFRSEGGFEFVSERLPRVLARLRGAKGKTTSILGPDGTPIQIPAEPINTSDMVSIYKDLGKTAKQVSRTDPSSRVPGKLQEVRQALLESMNISARDAGEDTYERFLTARDFFSEEYVPRFIEGTVGEIQRVDRWGNYTIIDDTVGEKFWQPGTREVNIQQLSDTFKTNNPALVERLGDDAQKLETRARESLRSFATHDLQRFLQMDPHGNMLTRIEKWERKFEGALKNFPEMRERVARLKDSANGLNDDLALLNNNILELDRISSRYTDIDQDQILDRLYKGTEKQAVDLISDMHKASGMERVARGDGGLPIHVESDDPIRVNNAVRSGFVAEIFNRNVDQQTKLPDWKKVQGYIHSNRKKLQAILPDQEFEDLENVASALEIMGRAHVPTKPADLQGLNSALRKINMSLPSISSRYYAYQLGKVSRHYVLADGAARILNALTDKNFEHAYSQVMYDLDGLQKVLDHMGNPGGAMEVRSMTEAFLKSFPELVKQTSREAALNMIRSGIPPKVYQILERAEESDEYFRAAEDAEKRRLLEQYLIVNDPYTGQTSRVGDPAALISPRTKAHKSTEFSDRPDTLPDIQEGQRDTFDAASGLLEFRTQQRELQKQPVTSEVNL